MLANRGGVKPPSHPVKPRCQTPPITPGVSDTLRQGVSDVSASTHWRQSIHKQVRRCRRELFPMRMRLTNRGSALTEPIGWPLEGGRRSYPRPRLTLAGAPELAARGKGFKAGGRQWIVDNLGNRDG